MLYFHVWELVPNQGKNIFFVATENRKKVFGRVLLETLSGGEHSVSQMVPPRMVPPTLAFPFLPVQ